jgi:hypothetical protein
MDRNLKRVVPAILAARARFATGAPFEQRGLTSLSRENTAGGPLRLHLVMTSFII